MNRTVLLIPHSRRESGRTVPLKGGSWLENYGQAVKLLRHVADHLEDQGHYSGDILDDHGNFVGNWWVTHA